MALMFRSVLQSGGGAELIVTCDSEFAGATISCSDGTTTLNKTCPVSSPYEVTFKIPNSGDWTISATVSGTTYSSDPISVDLDYETDLEFGFNWQRWVDTSVDLDSTDYSTLADLLADEEAVRELCLEHACVDYLCRVTDVNTDLETVISDNYFAKWVNNSDYALDKMYANAEIKTAMDTADKYGYGEWVITDSTTTPVTWGPKGNVPVMTSNTAPYGNTVAPNEGSNTPAYYAFDENPSTRATNNNTGYAEHGLGYKFVNPICPKKATIHLMTEYTINTLSIQGSNDGTNWVNVSEVINNPTKGINLDVPLNTSEYYLYVRARMTGPTTSRYGVYTLQFYGRELKVSVPVMSTNTTPYGVASASSIYSSDFSAWKAFDFSQQRGWAASASGLTDAWVQYEFVTPMVIKKFVATMGTNSYLNNMKVQGSNDGFVSDINDLLTFSVSASATIVENVTNSTPYKYYRVFGTTNTSGAGYHFQFYGLDYTEKEFEEGTTKKWLYDHGVEPNEHRINKGTDASQIYEERNGSSLYEYVNPNNKSCMIAWRLDTTPFDTLWGQVIDMNSVTAKQLRVEQTSGTGIGAVEPSMSDMPHIPTKLDISAVDQEVDVGFMCTYGPNYIEFNELWLE